jgi:hypothetical protein
MMMMSRSGQDLSIGDWVRVKGTRETACVERIFGSFREGNIFLDRSINGYWSWNAADLVKLKTKSRKVKP